MLIATRLIGFCLLLFAFEAQAVDCSNLGSTNINQSYNIEPDRLRECIAEGIDPPREWIVRGGSGVERQSGANEMGTGGLVSTGLKTAAEAVPFYSGQGCWYSQSNTMEGGESHGGAEDACESSGDGESSYGMPETSLFAIPAIPNVLTRCLSGLFGAVQTRTSGQCVSAGLNVCGMGVANGNVCAGTNGVRINGRNALTGGESLNIAGGLNSGPAGEIGTSGLSALRGPVSVAGLTKLELPDGQLIDIAKDSVITTTTDNFVQIRDSAGILLNEFDLKQTVGAAKLFIPKEGVDLDPGVVNADNYKDQTTDPYGNALPSCYVNRTC